MNDEPVDERRARTPRGLALPQNSLDDAVQIAIALNDLAGPSTREAIGAQLGVSPAGGRFRQRMAAAQYFGLIRRNGDRYELTDRGESLFSAEADRAALARSEAVMSTNFGRLIHMLRGREASDRTITARLRDDFQVPADAASRLATMLLESAEQAGLVSNGRFDVGAIEQHADVVPSGDLTVRPAAPRRASGNGRGPEASRGRTQPRGRSTGKAQDPQPESQLPRQEVAPSEGPLGLQVVLQIDAAKLGVDDTLRLLKALRVIETDSS
jgi:hypothetical protein